MLDNLFLMNTFSSLAQVCLWSDNQVVSIIFPIDHVRFITDANYNESQKICHSFNFLRKHWHSEQNKPIFHIWKVQNLLLFTFRHSISLLLYTNIILLIPSLFSFHYPNKSTLFCAFIIVFLCVHKTHNAADIE